MDNKPYTVPKVVSKRLEVGEVAVLIPYEKISGEIVYYTLVKSKADNLFPGKAEKPNVG